MDGSRGCGREEQERVGERKTMDIKVSVGHAQAQCRQLQSSMAGAVGATLDPRTGHGGSASDGGLSKLQQARGKLEEVIWCGARGVRVGRGEKVVLYFGGMAKGGERGVEARECVGWGLYRGMRGRGRECVGAGAGGGRKTLEPTVGSTVGCCSTGSGSGSSNHASTHARRTHARTQRQALKELSWQDLHLQRSSGVYLILFCGQKHMQIRVFQQGGRGRRVLCDGSPCDLPVTSKCCSGRKYSGMFLCTRVGDCWDPRGNSQD
jgi:hypothetical protein